MSSFATSSSPKSTKATSATVAVSDDESKALIACAFVWYSPVLSGCYADDAAARAHIEQLVRMAGIHKTGPSSPPAVTVSYLKRGYPHLLLGLACDDLASSFKASKKLRFVAQTLLSQGHDIHLAAAPPDADLSNICTFSISRTDGGIITSRVQPHVNARAILNAALRPLRLSTPAVFGTHRSDSQTLRGRLVLPSPKSAIDLPTRDDLFCPDPHNQVDEHSNFVWYRVALTRPALFVIPEYMNEMVVYAGKDPLAYEEASVAEAHRLIHGDRDAAREGEIGAVLQAAVERYNRDHPDVPGTVSEVELFAMDGNRYGRFRCSHPAIADALSYVDIGTGYCPAFVYHLNADLRYWRRDAMRRYSDAQAEKARHQSVQIIREKVARHREGLERRRVERVSSLTTRINKIEENLKHPEQWITDTRDEAVEKVKAKLASLRVELREARGARSVDTEPYVGRSKRKNAYVNGDV